MSTTQLTHNQNELLDEETLIEEARLLSQHRHRRRGLLVITLVAVTGLIVVGAVRFFSATSTAGRSDRSASTLAASTCSNARVRLLGVTSIPGAAVSAGILVRASVSSSVACSIGGYPTLQAQLSSRSTVVSGDQRSGIFGGLPLSSKSNSTLPRIPITSRSREVSFTIAYFSGNGPPCPRINSVQMTLPGSQLSMTARSMRAGGMVGPQILGSYCGNLDVTPLVNGSSGKS
jgi:hypothetical protein